MIQYHRRVHNQLINIDIFVFQLQFLLPVLLPSLQRCRCQFQFCVIISQKKDLWESSQLSSSLGCSETGDTMDIPLRYQSQCLNKTTSLSFSMEQVSAIATAHATYLLTFPAEVPPIPSNSCALMLVAALLLSTSAANWFMYSSCLLQNVGLLQKLLHW